MKKLIAQDTLVSLTRANDDYISFTDIARVRNPGEPNELATGQMRSLLGNNTAKTLK